MNDNETNLKGRKSLAVDIDTYKMLEDICRTERRTKIGQLRLLIEREHSKINGSELQAV